MTLKSSPDLQTSLEVPKPDLAVSAGRSEKMRVLKANCVYGTCVAGEGVEVVEGEAGMDDDCGVFGAN